MAVAVRQLAALPANVARRPVALAALSAADLPATSGWSDFQRAQLRERLLRERAVLDANAMLAELMRDFGLPLAVLLDRHGTVVADGAARDGAHGAIGLSLRHRNYFIDALAAGTASPYLVGRASREPGIYFSARAAQADSRAAGVVVLKQDTATLNRLFAENDGGPLQLVADAHGMIILGDRAPLLGQRLPRRWPARRRTRLAVGVPVGTGDPAVARSTLPLTACRHPCSAWATRRTWPRQPRARHPFTAWAFAPLPRKTPRPWPHREARPRSQSGSRACSCCGASAAASRRSRWRWRRGASSSTWRRRCR